MKKLIFKNKVKFDENKRIIELETPMGITLYFEYNEKDEMISVNDGNTFIGSYEYSENGQLSRYNDTDGVEIVYGYEEEEMVAMIITSIEGTNQIYDLDYDLLVPVYGLDKDNKDTVRIFDECGYLVDYSKMNDVDFYENSSYHIKKVEGNVIHLEFTER